MYRKACLLLLIVGAIPGFLYAQNREGRVYDAKSGEALPFATIKFGNTGQGVVADLDGRFEIPVANGSGRISYLEISSLGYQSKKVDLPQNKLDIYLQPQSGVLNEVVVTPPYDKMRRIINNTIANKNRNNPDKYEWYQCHVYYKMIADFSLPDSILNDTAKDNMGTKEFIDNSHLLMSETYSIRTWRRPQQLQEDVLASRFSGFKKSMFTSLVTDVLPFHAYNDYITLNGRDYHNPVSRGFEQYYKFNLADELMQGNDTLWILSFTPKGNNANGLKGTVYINSDGYAISRISATASDTMLMMKARIEQQYERIPVAGNEARWFPVHLNYIIDWKQKSGKTFVSIHMKGNSRIDSVTWNEDKDFHFDKTHTVRLANNADELTDTAWKTMRPEPLDKKEIRTYKVIDSIGEKFHLDRYMSYLSKLPEGKVPVSILDFDLKRLVNINQYENFRLGLGAQTNEHLIKWLSVGGWAGYGFGDAHWKYGAFAEVYADPYKEFVFKAGYTDDINDPGHVHLNRDLDKNYLSMYLLQRVDNTKTYFASVKKKFGYLSLELEGRQQDINPKYRYALQYGSDTFTTFTATEASLSWRYAYAERTAPFFGHYSSTGSRFPIWYGKVTSGVLESGTMQVPYTQAVTAVVWHKHINRLGFEHFLLEGGKSWSYTTLPLSKLFAGNGYKYDSKGSLQESIYTFGGMMTIYPYEYYTDQFLNFIFRHDFDWKLYKLESPDIELSSAPNICLQYNMLYGTLLHPELQKDVTFSVPDNAYHEAGILLNNLVRYRYLNLCYLTLNMGYYYHIMPGAFDAKHNGRVVFGAGVEF